MHPWSAHSCVPHVGQRTPSMMSCNRTDLCVHVTQHSNRACRGKEGWQTHSVFIHTHCGGSHIFPSSNISLVGRTRKLISCVAHKYVSILEHVVVSTANCTILFASHPREYYSLGWGALSFSAPCQHVGSILSSLYMTA